VDSAGRHSRTRGVGLIAVSTLALLGFLFWRLVLDTESPQLSNWRRAPVEATLVSMPGDSVTDRAWLTLSNGRGLRVECGLLTPRAPGPHPAMVVMAGRDTGKRGIQYVTGVRNLVVIALDYGYEPRDSYTTWTFIGDVPRMRRAAHDRGLAVAAMAYGGGDLPSLISHNFRRSQSALTSDFVGGLAWLLLRPIEPMRYAGRIAPIPLVMVNGEMDELVPRENVEAFFRRAREPKRLVWLPSSHVNPGNVELSRRVAAALRGEMLELGVLTPANVPIQESGR